MAFMDKLKADASRKKCTNLLETLNADIRTKFDNNVYFCAGGYDDYSSDIDELTSKFQAAPKKGVASEIVLNEFLVGKKSEMDKVIAADREMTTLNIRREAAETLRKELEKRDNLYISKTLQREEELAELLNETARVTANTEVKINDLKKKIEKRNNACIIS